MPVHFICKPRLEYPMQGQIGLGGGAGGFGVYSSSAYTGVEDVFSVDLFTGSGPSPASAVKITNNIDLATHGGMVIIKRLDSASSGNWYLFDTIRGTNSGLEMDQDESPTSSSEFIQSFDSDGFTAMFENSRYVAYTWRQHPKFFMMKQYSGNGSTQNVTHDLEATPNMMWVKKYQGGGSTYWRVYHQYMNGGSQKDRYYMDLSQQDGQNNSKDYDIWNDTYPTNSVFSVGDDDNVNDSGDGFMAYLFAGNGEDPDGNEQAWANFQYTNASPSNSYYRETSLQLDFDPQFYFIKQYKDQDGGSTSTPWVVLDNIKGPKYLNVAETSPESDMGYDQQVILGSSGLRFGDSNSDVNKRYGKYIIYAIRNHSGTKTASEVFAMDTGNGSATIPAYDSGFPVDFVMFNKTNDEGSGRLNTFNIGLRSMAPAPVWVGGNYGNDATTPDSGVRAWNTWNSNVGCSIDSGDFDCDSNYQAWMWRNNPGSFMCGGFDGTGSNYTLKHKLGVVPEMMWFKNYESDNDWWVYHYYTNKGSSPEDYYYTLNTTSDPTQTSQAWNDTAPTNENVYLGGGDGVNKEDCKMGFWLFASKAGISKVGHYSAGSPSLDIDMGFTPKFFLVKQTHSGNSYDANPWVMYGTGSGISYKKSFVADGSGFTNVGPTVISTNATGVTLPYGNNDTNADSRRYIYYAHA